MTTGVNCTACGGTRIAHNENCPRVAQEKAFADRAERRIPGYIQAVGRDAVAGQPKAAKQQTTPARFNPLSGKEPRRGSTLSLDAFRMAVDIWLFNPWTGQRRHHPDVISDPHGLLIIPPGEPLYAAEQPEYTGGSVSYYRVVIGRPTSEELGPYTAECNDIIEALGMNYAEGNAFKALWRRCAARTLGKSKAGYKDGLYDAEKVVFFGERLVAQEKGKKNG